MLNKASKKLIEVAIMFARDGKNIFIVTSNVDNVLSEIQSVLKQMKPKENRNLNIGYIQVLLDNSGLIMNKIVGVRNRLILIDNCCLYEGSFIPEISNECVYWYNLMDFEVL